MKRILLLTGLLAGMTFMTMAQTEPARKDQKTEKHHKSDTTKTGGTHKMKPAKKH